MRYRSRGRRFKHRSNGRGHQSRNNGGDQLRIGSAAFSNDRGRNNFKNHQNAEKLAEKYNVLAKEALSSGDKILSENYLQHADHFLRIIEEKALNQKKNTESPQAELQEKKSPENSLLEKNNKDPDSNL